MKEEFIKDYLKENELNTYSDFDIEIVCDAGGIVIVNECEKLEYGYKEQHNLDMLDLLVWMYSKFKAT